MVVLYRGELTLEKIEGTIKNEESRETGNTVYSTQDEDNKTKLTIQKGYKMSNIRNPPKPGMSPGAAEGFPHLITHL